MTAATDESRSEQSGHAIVRCKGCKRRGTLAFTIVMITTAFNGRMHQRQEAVINGRTMGIRDRNDLGHKLHRAAPACTCDNPDTTVKMIRAFYVQDIACGPRCLNAVGPDCECSCNGTNHGSGHSAW